MEKMTNEQIKEIFLANGFTIKEGETDLKPYVYQAARALLSQEAERTPTYNEIVKKLGARLAELLDADHFNECESLLLELLKKESAASAVPALEWRNGEPPHPWREEWFIAETIYDDRVVLKALPEEYSYQYKTADETYMIAKNIKRWMQFPDSEFISPSAPTQSAAPKKAGPPFVFDRYINGNLMAEGVAIEREITLESAMRIAAKIASRGTNGEVPVLVLKESAPTILTSKPDQWQPIATAPKDGTCIWGYTVEGDQLEVFWEEAEDDGIDSMGHDAGFAAKCGSVFPGRSFGNPTSFYTPFNQPTHWMPLPEAPTAPLDEES